MIKRLLITVAILSGAIHLASGQVLVAESKAALKVSYQYIIPMGSAEATRGSFTFPALFSNFRKGHGFSVQFRRDVNKSPFTLGFRGAMMSFSDWWYNSDATAFQSADASVNALNVCLGVKTRFHEKGRFNKLNFSGSISPGFYFISANLPVAINQYVSNSGNPSNISGNSESGLFGVLVNAGAEYAVSNSLALHIEGGYEYIPKNSSVVYMEKSIQWVQISAGLTLRLMVNKDYLRTIYE